MRTGVTVDLNPIDRKRQRAIVDDRNSLQKPVWRARIVLFTADALGTVEIMRAAGVSKTAVWRWQAPFMEAGVEGLLRDKARPPGTPRLGDDVAQRVVALTLGEPPGETAHWTGRLMAKVAGVGLTSVQRIWKTHGLAPHRIRTFKLSNGAQSGPPIRRRAAMRVALSQRGVSLRGEPLIDQLPGGGSGGRLNKLWMKRRADQARFLSRQLSLPVSTMSQ